MAARSVADAGRGDPGDDNLAVGRVWRVRPEDRITTR